MSIRARLNLAVVGMIAIFLLAGLTTLHTVSVHAAHTRAYLQVRTMSHLTAWVRTEIYQHLASINLALGETDTPDGAKWPDYVLDDIDERIQRAEDDRERELWTTAREAIVQLSQLTGNTLTRTHIDRIRQTADVSLRALRNIYDLREHELMAQSARSSLAAQKAVGLACVLTIVLFLSYLVMIRKWLLQPVDVLKHSADVIGDGHLEHRVPIYGDDELAQLARRVDAMAAKLSRHQEALIEARELSAVGELCTNVAHGLRNPLASIRATAQLSLRHSDETGELRDAAEEIIEQTDRMNNRITELFKFSRPMEVARDCTTFRELAETARAEVSALIAAHQIKLLIDDDTENAIWCLDRKQIAAALTELITNAIHHSEDGREVIVHSDRLPPRNGQGSLYRIQVQDVGAGMPDATIKKAFTPFFSARPNGTGMGLAIVRRIVERHQGTVDISSRPGVGTTVTMTFRCLCPNPRTENADPSCRARLNALRERQSKKASD